MQPDRPFSSSSIRNFIIAAVCILTTASCTIVKNYPANRPFVYETNINITGNITSDTAEMIVSRLRGQLDDSMRSRAISKVIWKVMKNPPRYDSNSAERSMVYMKALLKSLGYFKDTIDFNAKINKHRRKEDQFRTTVTFNVKPGKPVRLDSISFNLKKPELQQLALNSKKESLLKKGAPFAKTTISQELDRLTELYRENGYLKFGRDLLQGLWDTLDVSVLKPTLDPLEQIQILEKLKEQRENPKADLEIRLKPGIDTNRLTKYYIGDITVIPDFNYADTAGHKEDSSFADGIKVVSRFNLFKSHIFPAHIYLYRGNLYDQRNFSKTINRFNSLGAWRLVNIDPKARPGQDTADFIIQLTPATKYSLTTNLEGSLNNSVVSGNLAGISINANLLNRNVWKAANQSNTSIRYGIETGRDKVADVKFIQTRQFSFSHSIYFPRPILIHSLLSKKLRENARTIFSVNAAATERRSLFNLTTVNASWGYEFQWEKSSLTVRIPNFEYSYLKPKPKLDTLFMNNPGLQYVFTDGFISSIIASYTRVGGKNDNRNLFRANMEASGLAAGLIKNSDFLDSNLYRFIKIDAEFIRKIVIRKSALALRFFAGVGYEFDSTGSPNKRNNLPFFKQYFAGGPNSMRAWPLRKLGPGSSVKSFDLNPERYGDVQLEANIEYRFPFFKLAGIKVNGAVFTDIGNIWYMKKAKGRKDEEVFNFSRLGKDIAIGAGFGLRIDPKFFVIRFDYSYKVKDPSPEDAARQNKWFYDWKPFNGQFQLGISYPFIL